jgi:hypothetical protein
MQKLAETIPKLSIMEIAYTDMSSITINDMLLIGSRLETLALNRCEIPVRWFSVGASSKAGFGALKALDLSGSSRVCKTHLEDLESVILSELETLLLNKCYRVDDRALESLVKLRFFKSLRAISLNETGIGEKGLGILVSKAEKLKAVSAIKCKNINAESFKESMLTSNVKNVEIVV